ncbi:MAG TPA: hypothetical protein VNH11_03295 [Pirellulales bacterium]|nr:hypothetical protein [Pirellulales bacterium]
MLNAQASAIGTVSLGTTSSATITAESAAASVSFAAGTDSNGVAVSGGGAESMNVILSTANAYLKNSDLTSKDVSLTSQNNSDIEAHVVAVAAALGIGETGAGIAVGASIAQNYIGYTAGSDVNRPTPAQVQASAQNSTITATGNLTLSANAQQETVVAYVTAVAADISAGGKTGIGLAGSGADVENRVATDVEAYIANVPNVQVVGGPTGTYESTTGSISAAKISLTATDTSSITAQAVGVSVAGTVGGKNAGALSIGVSLAHNDIRNHVAAFMLDANANGAAVTLSATENATISATAAAASLAAGLAGTKTLAVSGAGAEATNVILTTTNAYLQGSSVATTGDVTIASANASTISATIVGASLAAAIAGNGGAGASIGVALARNYIGFEPNAPAPSDYSSDTDLPNGLTPGTTVEISSGVGAGDVYTYLGPAQTGDVNLQTQDYFDPSLRQPLNVSSAPAQTEAYVLSSSITAGGNLSVTATASQTITATVVAASGAVAGGSKVGMGLSGAGANSTNQINMEVEAYIDENGNSADGITAANISLKADDTSLITAVTVGASLAAAYGGDEAGVAVSIGVALATNEIDNQVLAEIENAPQVGSQGAITLAAQEQAGIHTVAVAASLGVALSGNSGIAVSGAGANATNVILTKTNALIENGAVTAHGDVDITANASSSSPSASLTVPSTYTSLTKTTGASTPGASAFAADLDYAGQTHDLANNETDTVNGQRMTFKAGTPDPDIAFLTQLQSTLAKAGFPLSTNPLDLAVTVRQPGAEWSVTDRSSGMTVTIALNSGTFSSLEPEISATVIGASLAAGGGDEVGVDVAIGAALAQNLIGQNGSENAAQVQAQIINASVNAGTGALNLTATAAQSIDALVGAFAVALAGSDGLGLAGAGAGANALNEMAALVTAAVDGDGSAGIQAGSITLQATDSSSIEAVTGAAALAVSVGGGVELAAAVGAAIADNEIGNDVAAYLSDANNIITGTLQATADEEASIDATTFAAAAAAALGKGAAVAAGVLTADNTLTNTVAAYIANSAPIHAGAVTLSASDAAVIQAYSLSLAVSGGGVGVAVGLGEGNNAINDNVSAYVSNSSITAAGAISVTAASAPTITTTSHVAAISAILGAAAAVFDASTTIGGTTSAYLQNAALTAPGQAIQVTARSMENLNPTVTGGAGALVGVAVLTSTATVRGSTQASLEGQTTVSAGSLTVTANDAGTAAPVTNVGGVGGISVNDASAATTLGRQTEATIPAGASIRRGRSAIPPAPAGSPTPPP